MTRYWLAGVALVLGYVLSLVIRPELPPALAGSSCCVPCGQAPTTATGVPPPSTETQPASHFVHFAMDGLSCKSGDEDFQIKRIEFQYKGEGIIDSHIVQLATLADRSENQEAAETLKKVLSILESIASKCETCASTSLAAEAMSPVGAACSAAIGTPTGTSLELIKHDDEEQEKLEPETLPEPRPETLPEPRIVEEPE